MPRIAPNLRASIFSGSFSKRFLLNSLFTRDRTAMTLLGSWTIFGISRRQSRKISRVDLLGRRFIGSSWNLTLNEFNRKSACFSRKKNRYTFSHFKQSDKWQAFSEAEDSLSLAAVAAVKTLVVQITFDIF